MGRGGRRVGNKGVLNSDDYLYTKWISDLKLFNPHACIYHYYPPPPLSPIIHLIDNLQILTNHYSINPSNPSPQKQILIT